MIKSTTTYPISFGCISNPTGNLVAHRGGGLAAEGEDVGAARARALLGVIWEAVVLRSRADVASAVANLGLWEGESCGGKAGEEEGVEVELHLERGLVDVG